MYAVDEFLSSFPCFITDAVYDEDGYEVYTINGWGIKWILFAACRMGTDEYVRKIWRYAGDHKETAAAILMSCRRYDLSRELVPKAKRDVILCAYIEYGLSEVTRIIDETKACLVNISTPLATYAVGMMDNVLLEYLSKEADGVQCDLKALVDVIDRVKDIVKPQGDIPLGSHIIIYKPINVNEALGIIGDTSLIRYAAKERPCYRDIIAGMIAGGHVDGLKWVNKVVDVTTYIHSMRLETKPNEMTDEMLRYIVDAYCKAADYCPYGDDGDGGDHFLTNVVESGIVWAARKLIIHGATFESRDRIHVGSEEMVVFIANLLIGQSSLRGPFTVAYSLLPARTKRLLEYYRVITRDCRNDMVITIDDIAGIIAPRAICVDVSWGDRDVMITCVA